MDLKQHTLIESIGVYLPNQSVSTDDILQGCKNRFQFPLEKITGIQTRRVVGQDEYSIDLAEQAVNECLASSKYNPADIDLLICCNISRIDELNFLSFEPSTSIKLRHHFGFSNAIVFDLTNACAGMFTGIYIVNDLIKTGAIRRGMVVSGEYITHLTGQPSIQLKALWIRALPALRLETPEPL
jgi:3-oxoacyl-[acyl-carrier-protein] synthase III